MNPVDRRVKLLVGQAVADAYGLPVAVPDGEGACEACGGDGCYWCAFSGLQSAVKT